MPDNDLISTEPEICSGKPRVKGMRATVGDVVEYFAARMSVTQICEDMAST